MQVLDIIDLPKEQSLEYLESDNALCFAFFELATSDHERAWKAGWILNKAVQYNIFEVADHTKQICAAVEGKPSNQKRELLKLLEHCPLSEDVEGYIFDVAVSCWEDLGAQSATRMVAFRLMVKIAKRHELLVSEISVLSSERFLKGLSPGINRSIKKRRDDLLK